MPFVQPHSKLKTDIFVKHEGYCAIKFLSDKAKQWAHNAKIPNNLDPYSEKGFCGKPIWNNTTKNGLYEYGATLQAYEAITKAAIKERDFNIESEFY